MTARAIAVDFSLIWEGLEIGEEFGLPSLEELARVGRFLEHAFYEPGSLALGPDGVTFRLRNPPLRMGAFSRVRVRFDGTEVDGERAWVQPDGAPSPLRLNQIDREHPIALPIGRPTRFLLEIPTPVDGPHTVRLELHSVAIPPLVWAEITDVVRRDPVA